MIVRFADGTFAEIPANEPMRAGRPTASRCSPTSSALGNVSPCDALKAYLRNGALARRAGNRDQVAARWASNCRLIVSRIV
jgi:hypothetical protein